MAEWSLSLVKASVVYCFLPIAVLAILDYLNKQNRPYSAVDILNNLHKEYGKTVSLHLTLSLLHE